MGVVSPIRKHAGACPGGVAAHHAAERTELGAFRANVAQLSQGEESSTDGIIHERQFGYSLP